MEYVADAAEKHLESEIYQKIAEEMEALAQGKKEGFNDRFVGSLILEKLLAAGFTRQTITNCLPSSAKLKQGDHLHLQQLGKKLSKLHQQY